MDIQDLGVPEETVFPGGVQGDLPCLLGEEACAGCSVGAVSPTVKGTVLSHSIAPWGPVAELGLRVSPFFLAIFGVLSSLPS